MKLPLPLDYQMAMDAPSVAFLDEVLRRGRPRRNPLGLPASVSGGFALTFDVTADGTRYAVRCFHKQGNHLQQRYAVVADFIRTAKLDFLVEVDYLHAGIRVGAETYPIVRMPWILGARLDDWIDDHLHDPAALNRVRRYISAAVTALRKHDAAHGDLQHGNILVRPDESIRLVDYDGMYLPALRHLGAAEQGHRNYQHPERAAQYDSSLDLFAGYVIDVSMVALTHEPQLWKELNKNSGEGLLFSAEDFADPARSPAFTRLAAVPALTEQVQRLRNACGSRFEHIPAALAGTATPTASRRGSAFQTAPAPIIIRATDRQALLAHQGDEVTVIGRIVATNTIQGQRGGTITFLNFGNYRRGAFTVVAWERAHRDLIRNFGDPGSLANGWVSVTGLLSVYQRPRSSTVTPQIELRNARSVRPVTAAQAAAMLAPASRPTPAAATVAPPATNPPTSPAPPPPTPTTSKPRSSDLNDRLGRLYSSPAFGARLSSAGSTSAAPQPGSSHPSATPRQPSPSATGPIRPPKPSQTPYQPVSSPPNPPPRRPPQYVPTQPLHPVSQSPGLYQWPPATTSHARGVTGLGVGALVAAVAFGPLGLIMAIVVLAQRSRHSGTDRICAWFGLVIGSLVTLLCGCSIMVSLLTSAGSQ